MERNEGPSGAVGAVLGPVASRLTRRPLLSVAVVAGVFAVGHAIWIITHRRLGTYDPDEAGYIATALGYHRTLTALDLRAFVQAVGGTANGPVVPLLSLPFLLVGPADPRMAMMVQPVLLVCAALLATALTRKIAGPGAAVMAGVTCVAMPTFVMATQSYWYGLGAGVVIGATVLALLESERLTNRWSWVFGVGCGLMVMTRTMTLGYLPGVALAALFLAWPDRAALRRLVASLAVAAAIVGPWFLVNRAPILDYLLSYGYGPRAGLFGSGNVLERAEFRVVRIADGAGVGVGLAVLLTGAVLGSLLRYARSAPAAMDLERARRIVVIAVPGAVGFVALVSTSNSGVWFELPLVLLMMPLIAMAIAPTFRPVRLVVVATVVVMLVLVSLTSWWIIDPRPGPEGFRLAGAHYEGGFVLYDDRFSVAGRGGVADEAAAEWAGLASRVTTLLRPIDASVGGAVFTMSGSMQLFNTNNIRLEAELEGWGARVVTPDTARPRSELLAELTPLAVGGRSGPKERVVIIAHHDQHLFTPDAEVEAFADLAYEVGWRPVHRVPMPDGGEVQILRLVDR